MTLTDRQRQALTALDRHDTVPIEHPARPDQRPAIPPTIARALVQNGWATAVCHADGQDLLLTGPQHRPRAEDPGRLTITPDGQQQLRHPIPDTPRLLRRTGSAPIYPRGVWPHQDPQQTDPDAEHGYTSRRHAAISDEPEAIDPAVLAHHWATSARDRHEGAQDARDRARRLRRDLIRTDRHAA